MQTNSVVHDSYFQSGGLIAEAITTGGNLGTALSQLSGEAATGAQQGAFQLGSQGRAVATACLIAPAKSPRLTPRIYAPAIA